MNIIPHLFDSYPFQLMVAAAVSAFRLRKRKWFYLRMVLLTLPILFLYNFSSLYMEPVTNYILDRFFQIGPVLYVTAVLLFSCKCSILDAIYCIATAHLAQNIVYNLYRLLQSIFPLTIGSYPSLALSVGLMAVVYSAFYYFFARHLQDMDELGVRKKWIVGNALLIMIFVIFQSTPPEESSYGLLTYLSYILGNIIALIMQYGLFTKSALEQRYAITEQLLYQEQKRHNIVLENVELINRKCHDLKHQISGLRMIDSSAERNAYIQKMEKAILIYESAQPTGNETLDLIMLDKFLFCEEHDIKLTFVGDASKINFMDTMDIYSLMGNALDNAIESVSEEPDVNKRVISFRVGQTGALVSIHFENYVREPVVLVNGMPKTRKKDTGYHGFGMLSIQRIAEKYGGGISIDCRGNQFCLDIMMPAGSV